MEKEIIEELKKTILFYETHPEKNKHENFLHALKKRLEEMEGNNASSD